MISVYVLAIGVKGLQLAGAPFWLPDMFNCAGDSVVVTAAASAMGIAEIQLAKSAGALGAGRGPADGGPPPGLDADCRGPAP